MKIMAFQIGLFFAYSIVSALCMSYVINDAVAENNSTIFASMSIEALTEIPVEEI